MFLHPTLASALAEQHRRDLTSQASACRLARTARQAHPRRQSRRSLTIKALRTAVGAAALAGTAFLVIPSGSGPAVSANGRWGTVPSHSDNRNWSSHPTVDNQSSVLAVHFRLHRFGAVHLLAANHRFAAGHVYAERWA